MNVTNHPELREQIKALAAKKATGTPKQLSEKLGVSLRNLYRLIRSLRYSKELGEYCRTRQGYTLDGV